MGGGLRYWLRSLFAALLVPAVLISSTTVGWADGAQTHLGYTIEELSDLYVELTFNLEGNRSGAKLSKLKKWSDELPVKVLTYPADSLFDQGDRFRETIDKLALISAEIERKSVVNFLESFNADRMIEWVNSSVSRTDIAYANSITVFVGSRTELGDVANRVATEVLPGFVDVHKAHLEGSRRADVPLCYGVTIAHLDAPSQLFRSWILLEDSTELENCIWEELMQAFGLFNDFPAGTPSMFNDDMVHIRPTDLDWLLWRVHFDDRLVAGMTEDEVRAVLPKIISELIEN